MKFRHVLTCTIHMLKKGNFSWRRYIYFSKMWITCMSTIYMERNYYTLHILLYYLKVIRQVWCFTEIYWRGRKSGAHPNIYHAEEDNRLSTGLHPLTTGSALKIRCCLSGSIIVFTLPEIILLSTTKLKSSLKHLWVVSI